MEIMVNSFGLKIIGLEKADNNGWFKLKLSDRSSIRDAITRLELQESSVGIIYVNRKTAKHEYELKAGDKLTLLPKVVGG